MVWLFVVAILGGSGGIGIMPAYELLHSDDIKEVRMEIAMNNIKLPLYELERLRAELRALKKEKRSGANVDDDIDEIVDAIKSKEAEIRELKEEVNK